MEPLSGFDQSRQGSHLTRAVRASDAGHTSQSDHACTTGEDAREHTFEHSTAGEQFGPVHAGGWSAGRQMNARYFFVSRAVVCAVWLAFALPVSATPTPSNPSQPAVKPVAAAADSVPAKPTPWKSLSSAQRQLLDMHREEWDSLPASRQQALACGAARWLSMNGTEREAALERFNRFTAMPQDRQELLRRRWQEFLSLSGREQATVRDHFHAFQTAPAEQQEALRREWLAADHDKRVAMLEQLRQQKSQRH